MIRYETKSPIEWQGFLTEIHGIISSDPAKILKEAEHGLFSYYLMKGLEGLADSNNDQQITNGELHAFIKQKVSRQANQTPQLSGNPDQVLVQW